MSERDVVRRATEMIIDRLPKTWTSTLREQVSRGGRRVDAELTLQAPDGASVRALIEAKRGFDTRDVEPIAEQLSLLRANVVDEGESITSVFVAPYINPSARARLTDLGVGYADATGNIRIAADRPALFLRDVGEDVDPWRGPGRPRGSFKGGSAARVFRALIDVAPPYSVPELVKLSDASPGVTYRVVEFLEREALLRRAKTGVVDVDWRGLIERWSRDYGFSQSATTAAFIEPRGLDRARERLRASDLTYALTSSSGAEAYAPYAPVRSLSVYVESIDEAVETLGLRSAATGGNVLLSVPEDSVAFVRAQRLDGLTVAAPSQVAADLLGGSGRAPEEGRFLLDWMEANESSWRG